MARQPRAGRDSDPRFLRSGCASSSRLRNAVRCVDRGVPRPDLAPRSGGRSVHQGRRRGRPRASSRSRRSAKSRQVARPAPRTPGDAQGQHRLRGLDDDRRIEVLRGPRIDNRRRGGTTVAGCRSSHPGQGHAARVRIRGHEREPAFRLLSKPVGFGWNLWGLERRLRSSGRRRLLRGIAWHRHRRNRCQGSRSSQRGQRPAASTGRISVRGVFPITWTLRHGRRDRPAPLPI